MKLSTLISKYKDTLKGGKGDSTKIDSIDKKQLAVGVLVELEHTSNPTNALEIAIDHLSEDQSYYTKLIKSGIVDEKKALDLYKKLYTEMKKSELKNIVTEIYKELTESLGINPLLIDLHFAKDQNEYNSISKNIQRATGWDKSDISYMLSKLRKDIGYGGPEFWDNEKEFTYEDLTNPNTKYRRFRKQYGSKVKDNNTSWNSQRYRKWIKDMASNGGSNHAFDMAQNAKHEPGLIDYVRKQIKLNYGDETPLERIQWDIEQF